MDTYEAKVLLEDSVRCLARMMDQIRLRELEKCVGWNEPMQDHLAQCVSPCHPYEGSDFKECLEYLKDLHKGFKTASDHEIKMGRTFKPGNIELGQICDMAWGFIGHGFPEKLVACAKEIEELALQVLPQGKNRTKSDKVCQDMLKAFCSKAASIIEKYGYKDWSEGDYSIQLGYLSAWMYRKYWEK